MREENQYVLLLWVVDLVNPHPVWYLFPLCVFCVVKYMYVCPLVALPYIFWSPWGCVPKGPSLLQ